MFATLVGTHNPATLEHFAEDGGVAIDTTDLYRLLLSVTADETSPSDARAFLRATRGRGTWQRPAAPPRST